MWGGEWDFVGALSVWGRVRELGLSLSLGRGVGRSGGV